MRPSDIDVHEHRKPDHPVEDLIVERWSPRALSGEPISDEELASLFEAARWAPSSYNGQPWRFIYARRDTEHWQRLYDLMGEWNQTWTRNAAVLIVVVSRDTFEHNDKPAQTHSFDTGAAWQNLALQARAMGLIAHGMQGFDYKKARKALGVPRNHTVEAMVAVGRPGQIEELPDSMRGQEKPSGRKPVAEIAFEGRFPG